jgi:hypothetical protein
VLELCGAARSDRQRPGALGREELGVGILAARSSICARRSRCGRRARWGRSSWPRRASISRTRYGRRVCAQTLSSRRSRRVRGERLGRGAARDDRGVVEEARRVSGRVGAVDPLAVPRSTQCKWRATSSGGETVSDGHRHPSRKGGRTLVASRKPRDSRAWSATGRSWAESTQRASPRERSVETGATHRLRPCDASACDRIG